MQKYKTILIDDEPHARSLLRKMIQAFCPDLEVVAEAADLPQGVKAIVKHKPDLVFLDIEMPGHSGLEILDFFEEDSITFSIVFTTAYDQYALKAFKLSAVDYLLKPIEPDELEGAVSRFLKRNKAKEVTVKEAAPKTQEPYKIAVSVTNGIKFIELSDILYLKAEGSYTELILKDFSKLLISKTLKTFEEALAEHSQFFRTGKSFLVNIEYVTDYVKSGGGYLVMQNQEQVPITTDKAQLLISHSEQLRKL